MHSNALIFLISSSLCLSYAELHDSVIIELKNGRIEGDLISAPNSDFLAESFKGIPYGVAEFLEKAKPAPPWTGIKKTKAFSGYCFQHLIFGIENSEFPNENAAEDCLYLNVFAPHKKNHELYPVMVYVHGGGFAEGASTEFGQEGIVEWLLIKGVIIVTINYRLGPFGFFSTGNSDAPGNYGLWDQTLALQWVNENIERFGGDPQKVTVFGESAGGASVSLLSLSPHSRDLFQQLIIMSGSSLMPWIGLREPSTLNASDILSKSLGCGPLLSSQNAHVNSKVTVKCLKSKSTIEIVQHLHAYRPFLHLDMITFTPVMDGDFIPKPIDELFKNVPPKPTISGTTTDESGYFITPLLHLYPMDIEWVAEYEGPFTFERFLRFLHVIFPERKYHQYTSLIHQLALHHYVDSVGDRMNTSFLIEQYKELFSDYEFLAPQYEETLLRHKTGSTLWLYSFDYYDHGLFLDSKFKGAQHYLEMNYLFKTHTEKVSPWTGNNLKIVNIMTTLWTNFAKYGHPNPEDSDLYNEFIWEPITDEYPERYLHIGLDTRQRQHYHRRMMSFWHQLLPNIKSILHQLEMSTRKENKKIEL